MGKRKSSKEKERPPPPSMSQLESDFAASGMQDYLETHRTRVFCGSDSNTSVSGFRIEERKKEETPPRDESVTRFCFPFSSSISLSLSICLFTFSFSKNFFSPPLSLSHCVSKSKTVTGKVLWVLKLVCCCRCRQQPEPEAVRGRLGHQGHKAR